MSASTDATEVPEERVEEEGKLGEHSLRVLVVLLRNDQRKSVVDFLTRYYFYTVTGASNVEQAWGIVLKSDSPYQVVIIDDMIPAGESDEPAIRGLELMARIKARSPQTEAIIITSRNLREIERAESAGAFRCLTTSFNMTELAILVRHASEFQMLKQAAREKQAISALIETGATLLGGHSRTEALRLILKGAQSTGFDRVRLYLLSENHLFAEAQVGIDGEFEGLRWPIEEDYYFRILLEDPRPHRFRRDPGIPGPVGDLRDDTSVSEWACVPVVRDSKVIGRLLADKGISQKPIYEHELYPLALFASQMEAALESEPLGLIERKAKNLKTVLEVSNTINSSLDIDDVLIAACRAAVGLIGVDHSGLVMFDDQHLFGQVCGEYPEIGAKGLKIPVHGSQAEEQLIATREPVVISDIRNDRTLGAIKEVLLNLGIKSILIVPIVSKDRVLGSFSLDSTKTVWEFSSEEIEMCKVFAELLAPAIENARLFSETKDRVAQLEALRKRLEMVSLATREIMSGHGFTVRDERLALIAWHTADILEAMACQIYLVNRPGWLSCVQSFDQNGGHLKEGLEFEIKSGTGTGLTGHVAYTRQSLNLRGDELVNHFAVRHHIDGLPPKDCYSVLAIPLTRKVGEDDQLIGVLRVEDKLGADGRPSSEFGFNADDESIVGIFAKGVVAAIAGAEAVERIERKNSELETERERAQRLVASSPSGIIAVDNHGKVTAFNDQAREIMGYDASNAKDVHVSLLYWDPKEPRRIRELLDQRPHNRFIREPSQVKHRDGTPIPVMLSATWLYDSDGKRIGSVGYFEDLRAANEAARRQEQLLEATNVIAKAESMEAGLGILARIFVSLLNNTFCRILLLDETNSQLLVKAAFIQTDDSRPVSWESGLNQAIPLSAWVGLPQLLDRGEPVVLSVNDQRFTSQVRAFSIQLGLSEEIQSLLMIPLKIGERTIGLLDVGELRADTSHGFTDEEKELAGAIAAQAAVLIDHRRQLEISERRKQLLTALDEAAENLRAEKEPHKLQKEVARLGAEVFGCSAGALLINRLHAKELEVAAVHGFPEALVGTRMGYDNGLVTDVARTGLVRISHNDSRLKYHESFPGESEFQTAAAVPLKRVGSVDFVLFIADNAGPGRLSQVDSPILERFGVHASIALQTSRLMTLEQRIFDRLTILNKIGEYLQVKQPAGTTDKILHAALTGVTAGYGLGFNRALLFFREESGELVGLNGIGQLEEPEARASWDRDKKEGLSDFVEYIVRLENGHIPDTALGRLARELRFPVVATETDALSRAVLERRHVLVPVTKLSDLPKAFIEALEPRTDVVVVPLIAREQVIGLFVVDNKFTQAPITHVDIEALLAFASTVAVAFDNIRLFRHREEARQKLRSLYEASSALISAKDPQQVLRDIVDQTRHAAQAAWVRIILIDEMGRAKILVTAGDTEEVSPKDAVRDGGIAHQVISRGKPEIIHDTSKHAHRLNPVLLRDRAMSALCLPLTLHERHLGVMWISFEEPRQFPDFEVDALQLYANHAAVAYDSARRMEELNHLRLAAEALSSADDTQEVLHQIVSSAREVVEADSAAIWSYDPVQNRFIPELSIPNGIPAEDWKRFSKVEPRAGGTAFTVLQEEYVSVEDISDVERYQFLGGSTRSLLSRIGARSFEGLALTVGDERLGVLYVNYNRARAFSEEEQQTARTFANHAALALKKTRLRDQLINARNAAKLVAEVTALENLPSTLKLIVQRTRDAVHSDAVTLYTYDTPRKNVNSPPEWEGVRDPQAIGGEVAMHSAVYKVLALNKMHVAEDSINDSLLKGAFVQREAIASSVGVPLMARGDGGGVDKVGVMFVNFRRKHRFTADELTNIELFANQAAVAIRNAQLYAQIQERALALEALYNAGKVVTASLDLGQILENIAEQANRLVDASVEQATFVHIRLVEGDKAKIAAGYPPGEKEKATPEIDLSGNEGIIARAVRTGTTQNVGDVTKDPDFVPCRTATKSRSELVVLLKKASDVIGVINVEHNECDAFSVEVERVLEALAAQASIAIENARQYEELVRTKTTLAARTALAWMGMASSSWRHAIEGHALTISEELGLLERDLGPQIVRQMRQRLEKIKRLAEQIKGKPITPALSDAEVESVSVGDWIRERTSQLWEVEPYKSAKLGLDIDDRADLRISITEDWLREAFDALVHNAVKAVEKCPDRRIRIKACRTGAQVEVTVTDSGTGMSRELRTRLFKEKITQPGRGGLGMGLLMAQMIVQTYGGDVYVKDTDETCNCGGTTMAIRFPLAQTGVRSDNG